MPGLKSRRLAGGFHSIIPEGPVLSLPPRRRSAIAFLIDLYVTRAPSSAVPVSPSSHSPPPPPLVPSSPPPPLISPLSTGSSELSRNNPVPACQQKAALLPLGLVEALDSTIKSTIAGRKREEEAKHLDAPRPCPLDSGSDPRSTSSSSFPFLALSEALELFVPPVPGIPAGHWWWWSSVQIVNFHQC